MKKIFLLSSLFLLTMVGCSEQTSSNNPTTSSSVTSINNTTSSEESIISENTSSINQALIEAKNEAKEALQDYVDRQTIQDKTKLNTLLNSILLKIDEASTIEQVNLEKANGLSLLQELTNTLKEMEMLKEKQKNAADELQALDLSNFDEEGKTQANEIIDQGVEDVYTANTEEEINNVVNKVKEDITKIKTKTEKFFNQMVYETTVDYPSTSTFFSFDNNKIINSNLDGWTEFHMGKQDGNTSSVVDFYINVNYKNVEWSNLTFKFRKWDNNSTFEVEVKDSSMTFNSVTWDNGTKRTVIENSTEGIKNNTKYHVQILSCGWQKTVLINDVKAFSINTSEYCVGYFGISTWQTSYTIEDALYQEYDDNTMSEKYGNLLF